MKKGEFEQEQKKEVKDVGQGGVRAEELLDLLKDDIRQEDVSQSKDISDAMLERLLDRSDLIDGYAGKALPPVGEGYEVVEEKDSASLLANVE